MIKPEGDFSEIPFPFLLFYLWQSRSTGLLIVEGEGEKRSLSFQDGEIVLPIEGIERAVLYEYLKRNEDTDLPHQKKPPIRASQKFPSPVKDLIEGGVMEPDRLWTVLEKFLLHRILPVFDWGTGHYTFDRNTVASVRDSLITASALELILHGVREMKNIEVIRSRLPEAKESLKALNPGHSNRVSLRAEEHYVYRMLQRPVELRTLCLESELGERATQKILFLLMCLGFAGKIQHSDRPHEEDPGKPLEMKRALLDWNEKCSYIFKYMSKEIGPVAQNVLEKSLDDIREHLSSVLKDIRLGRDGRFDEKGILEKAAWIVHPDGREAALRDMNEILAAEVLAIKSTLGNEHEAQLVRNLKKL